MSLEDLMRHVTGASQNSAPLVEVIPERADRILAVDRGRECQRTLTDEEIDSLPAVDAPMGAA